MTSPTKIRRQITRMVERRVAETGVPWYKQEFPWGRRCPLVNPQCPSDLCVLPAGHFGSEDGYHVLGTTPYSHAEKYPLEWMMPEGTSDEVLIREGWVRQQEMFPDDDR